MRNKIIAIDLMGEKFGIFKEYFGLFILIFCSIIGVGFVSGAEIFEFFSRFGNYSYFGIIVFFIMVYLIIYRILYKNTINFDLLNMANEEQKHYQKRQKIVKFKQKFYKIIIFFNVFVIASAMFSGLNYLIKNLYNNNFYYMFFITYFLVFVMLFLGIKCLKKIDNLVLIFTFFVIINLVCSMINSDNLLLFVDNGLKSTAIEKSLNSSVIFKLFLSLIYPVLYVFMNFFQVQPLVESSAGFVKNKKNCRIFALIFSTIFSLVLFIFVIFLKNNYNFCSFSMPLLEYFKSKGIIIRSVFCFGLVFCLVSTLISCLIGVKQNLSKVLNINNFSLTIISFVFALIFGFLPFDFYVSVAYPILGLLNFIIFVFC